MIISVPVVTRLQDNGDGGYTMYVYNNEDELIADHPRCRGEYLGVVDGKYLGYKSGNPNHELRDEILSGEDEYENGYVGSNVIKLVESGGVFKLAESLFFSAGQ